MIIIVKLYQDVGSRGLYVYKSNLLYKSTTAVSNETPNPSDVGNACESESEHSVDEANLGVIIEMVAET